MWADGKTVGQEHNAIPIIIRLKDPHLFPLQKQYPLKPKVNKRFKPTTDNLKEQRLLIPCNSPYNTPTLGVKKPNNK